MMRPLLLAGAVLLLAASPALAGTEDDVLNLVVDLANGADSCISAAVQGSVGVAIDSSQDPPVQLQAPTITPPSPDCLPTLPA
jgi:hypothetical protein